MEEQEQGNDRRRGRRGLGALYFVSGLTGVLLVPYALFFLFFADGPFINASLRGSLPGGHHFKYNDSIPLPDPEYAPPFKAVGRDIVDAEGTTVTLRSVNWYGASDVQFVPMGLDKRHRDDISRLIRRMGFNSVRLPYSDELLYKNPRIANHLLTANQDLMGSSALDVFLAVIKSLTDSGVYVIPNNHITQATWCCGANLCDASWKNDHLGPLCRVKQTETSWIMNWRRLMQPLAGNEFVIGADLRNEVRGLWGTMHWSAWAAAAERAAEALLEINPAWLMFVEGVSSANHLMGARDRPVRLSVPGRVVYEAHVYSWSGWGELSPYSRRTYNSFAESMRKNWAYLLEEDIAPVWIGEFGTPDWPQKGDLNYWQHLMQFLGEVDTSWGYWAINPRKPVDHEWETYGLVKDDWETGTCAVCASEPKELRHRFPTSGGCLNNGHDADTGCDSAFRLPTSGPWRPRSRPRRRRQRRQAGQPLEQHGHPLHSRLMSRATPTDPAVPIPADCGATGMRRGHCADGQGAGGVRGVRDRSWRGLSTVACGLRTEIQALQGGSAPDEPAAPGHITVMHTSRCQCPPRPLVAGAAGCCPLRARRTRACGVAQRILAVRSPTWTRHVTSALLSCPAPHYSTPRRTTTHHHHVAHTSSGLEQ